MKLARRISFALFAGAALTLAAAWIPPLVNPPLVSFPGMALAAGQNPPWIGASHTAWLGEPAWLGAEGRFGVGVRRSWGCVEASDLAYAPASGRWFFLLAAGWPFYAFHGGGVQYPPAGAINDERAPSVRTLPSWIPSRQNHAPSIAVAPLWRGLALDLAFWSLSAFLATQAIRSVRTTVRRRAGRCIECGYPVRAISAICPECGSAVTI
ncbi:MAG: hypothetical protein U0572_11515 [Phycisphaerales bacterium]